MTSYDAPISTPFCHWDWAANALSNQAVAAIPILAPRIFREITIYDCPKCNAAHPIYLKSTNIVRGLRRFSYNCPITNEGVISAIPSGIYGPEVPAIPPEGVEAMGFAE